MALGFNRKKAADAAPDATPDPAHNAMPAASPVTPSSFAPVPRADDLDAFDLEAFSAPSTEVEASGSTSASAFDFPETAPNSAPPTASISGASANDPLDFDQLFEIEQKNAAATKNEAPAPFVPPSAVISEPAAPFYAPQTPVISVPESQPKKKLPLVPILGALAVLGLAGGAASLLTRGSNDSDETAPIVNTTQVRTAPSTITPSVTTSTTAPSTATSRVTTPRTTTTGTTTTGTTTTRNTTSVVPARNVAPQLSTGVNPVSPGIAPSSNSGALSSSATSSSASRVALSPTQASAQLATMKALWKRGADAKQRRDFAGARRFWNQGLKIEPDNIGFQESIAKLPR